MIKPELMKYSLQNIYKRKTRSSLTTLSVLIGIAAITALISFGYGISNYVSELAQEMGTDKLIIAPKGLLGGMSIGSRIILNKSDISAINNVAGVEESAGMYLISAEVEYNKQKRYTYLIGFDIKNFGKLMEEMMGVGIIEGGGLSGNEKSKAIFGYSYMIPDRVFSKALKVGDKVKINGQDISVSGFYDEIGSPSDDSQIYITENAAEEVFGETSYEEIMVRLSPGENATSIAEEVTKELRRHRNQDKGQEDFFVQSFEQLIATFTSVLNVIIAVVLLIAVISVIVASVNIMNTMYASILERTKEIGVFKAIGARNSEILTIFVIESGMLSLTGGVIGLALGFAIAKIAGIIISAAGYGFLKPYFGWNMVFYILLFSLFVGLASGFLPAYNASKLKPVEALRYE